MDSKYRKKVLFPRKEREKIKGEVGRKTADLTKFRLFPF
jgi:hypothetical protein